MLSRNDFACIAAKSILVKKSWMMLNKRTILDTLQVQVDHEDTEPYRPVQPREQVRRQKTPGLNLPHEDEQSDYTTTMGVRMSLAMAVGTNRRLSASFAGLFLALIVPDVNH
jgi:hypothetical protein